MTNATIIPFPGHPPCDQLSRLAAPAAKTTIPFSRAQLLEVAAQINAASAEILTSIEANGGSVDTELFLDFLWWESRGLLPQPLLPGEADDLAELAD